MTEKMTDEEFAALDKRVADRESKQMDEDDSSILAAFDRGVAKKKAKEAAAAAVALNALPESMRVEAAAYATGAGFVSDAQRGWYYANLGEGYIDKTGKVTEKGTKAGVKPWVSKYGDTHAPKEHPTLRTKEPVKEGQIYHDVDSTAKTPREIVEKAQEATRKREKGQGKLWQPENKDEIQAILNTGEYALVSAGKNPKYPPHENLTPADFEKRHNELRHELEFKGITYTEVLGKYDGVEDSFLIMAHELNDHEAVDLGAKYEQDSIIYVKGGKERQIYSMDSHSDDKSIIKKGSYVEGIGYKNSAQEKDNFTEVTLKDGSKIRYTLKLEMDKNWNMKVRPPEGDTYFGAAKVK